MTRESVEIGIIEYRMEKEIPIKVYTRRDAQKLPEERGSFGIQEVSDKGSKFPARWSLQDVALLP